MSHYYDIVCEDCGTTHGDLYCNKNPGALVEVLEYRRAITAMAGSGIHLETEHGRIRAEWFKEHENHKLIVQSEYGGPPEAHSLSWKHEVVRSSSS